MCLATVKSESGALEINQKYWNSYYLEKSIEQEPSLFGKYVVDQLDSSDLVLDLGCGNGRDSFYFAKKGKNVIGIDYSETIVRRLNRQCTDLKLSFICCPFSELEKIMKDIDIGAIYSRFSLHSVSKKEAYQVLDWAYKKLEKEKKIYIELRTLNDELFNIGDKIEENAFFTDHYRRFTNPSELLSELKMIGFTIELFQCSKGFAPYADKDPEILRIIALK